VINENNKKKKEPESTEIIDEISSYGKNLSSSPIF